MKKLIRIELSNFQKHSNLIIDLTDGVNVIHGSTNAGKSCILRAIRWVYFNDLKGNIVRKDETDKTYVRLWFDCGTCVERCKSNSENSYSLIVDGEIKKYDAIGISIPDDIVNFLGSRPMEVANTQINLNFSTQFEPHFLFSQSGFFRTKVFNKITGNDITDSVLQSLNKDLLAINRDKKSFEIDSQVKISARLDLEIENHALNLQHDSANGAFIKVNDKISLYGKISSLFESNTLKINEYDLCNSQYKSIVLPDESFIGLIHSKISVYNHIFSKYNELNNYQISLSSTIDSLSLINIPDGIDNLKFRINKYNTVAGLNSSVSSLKESSFQICGLVKEIEKQVNIELIPVSRIEAFNLVKKLQDDIIGFNSSCMAITVSRMLVECEIDDLVKEHKSKLLEHKVCPICKTKMTEEVINEIKL